MQNAAHAWEALALESFGTAVFMLPSRLLEHEPHPEVVLCSTILSGNLVLVHIVDLEFDARVQVLLKAIVVVYFGDLQEAPS